MANEDLVLLHQQGDKQALESLIENNKGLVMKIVNKFFIDRTSSIDREDLEQEGFIGLIMAANKYDFNNENKAKFSTYAIYWIYQKVSRFIKQKNTNDEKSLNAPINTDGEIEILDTIEGIDYSFENVEEKIYIGQLRVELENAMQENNTLKEREILMLHYGWDTNKESAYIEIADIFNISSGKIINIESTALKKLRHSNWGQEKKKEYILSKLRSIKESSRYNQDSVANEINIIR